jgi:hypothetical protein
VVDLAAPYYSNCSAIGPGQAGLEQRIKEICQTRVRYGYRRVDVLLRREGWSLGQNKTRRIYRVGPAIA